jgi:threonine aldolase
MQAGIIAAAPCTPCHHVERLADDHRNARPWPMVGRSVACGRSESVETNIGSAPCRPANAAALVAEMAGAGVLCADLSPRTVRFVTHLDAGEDAVSTAVERLQPLLQ